MPLSRLRRLGWLVTIWLIGVTTLGALSLGLRFVMGLAGLAAA